MYIIIFSSSYKGFVKSKYMKCNINYNNVELIIMKWD